MRRHISHYRPPLMEAGCRSVMAFFKTTDIGVDRPNCVCGGDHKMYKDKIKGGRRQWRCSELSRQEHQNPEYLKRSARFKREQHETNRALAIDQLGNVCAACGGAENKNGLGKFEFDHKIPETKKFNIGSELRNFAFDNPALQAELDKCQLLHVECHKAKTAQEAGQSATAKEDQLEALINKHESEAA